MYLKNEAMGWIGIGLLLAFFTGCEVQHSKIKHPLSPYSDCLDTVRTADALARLRSEINADDKASRIEAFFHKKRLAGFNGNVLVAQRGIVLHQGSYGYARLLHKDTLRAEHEFQLASLSKPFTAVAILKLVEEGKLQLSDSVQRFIPQFPYQGVRISALLSHRSGLPNYLHLFKKTQASAYPSNSDVVQWLIKTSPTPQRPPDRAFSYNNTNYCVLAMIVEAASGMRFEEYLQRRLFDPLGMSDTHWISHQLDTSSRLCTVGHQYGRVVPKDVFDDVLGDKGLYSTTGDLYRFYRGLVGGCLLRPETLAEAFTPRSMERKGVKNYGYGFRMRLDEQLQPRYLYHTGWWKGYNSLMWFSREDDFVIIILSNTYNKSIYQINDLLTILHGYEQSQDEEEEL